MNNAPEKSLPDDALTQTFCELFWEKVELLFGNPAIHPCLGYRPYNIWHSQEIFNAYKNHTKNEPTLNTTTQNLKPAASSKIEPK